MSLLAPLKSLKIRLFSTFRIFKNCCQMTTNRLLIRKKTLTVWKLQTIKVILYSNLFFMFSQDDTFALKLDKSLCPVIYSSYSNSSHRRLISVISIAFSLLFIVVFAILAGIILTGIKIALKMYSYINPIIYSEIQKLSLIIAFAPEFFYQILKFCYRHSTIHFAPIFLLKERHFMH